jgi:hypothetical protein
MLVPINGSPVIASGFWSLEAGKITWFKILIPIIVFAVALLIFFVVQFLLQVAFKFFKRAEGPK